MWSQVVEIFEKYDHFLLTTHVNPDADGIGSATALIELLLRKRKKARFVCDNPIPQKFAFLDYHQLHETFHEEQDYSATEVVLILDTNRLERIGRLAALCTSGNRIVLCIDHHPTPASTSLWLAIDTSACSAGAMIYSLFKETHTPLNLQAATGIYASIIYDTGRFSYSSTNSNAHKIAEECIRMGVDPVSIHARLFQNLTLGETKIFASALHQMETYLDNKIAIQVIRQQECRQLGENAIEHIDLEYIHDFNYLIKEVLCFVLFREISDSLVRVSLRSKNEIDISHLVRQLGGGGHPYAAGIYWCGTLKEIKELILDQLIDLIANQKKIGALLTSPARVMAEQGAL